MIFGVTKPEYVQTTTVSTHEATSSAFSDVGSVVSLGDQISRSNLSEPADPVIENPKPAPVHPEFVFADGNIEIQTADQSFWVHEYHLNKFSVFATLIQAAKNSESALNPGGRITVACDEKTKGEDIYNTLKVVYASYIDGIPDFDSSTLVSALRIASTFDYPNLRKFAISKLEKTDLPAIQRIQLSDEFLVPSFEMPAFTELCSRSEPISPAEAEVLGVARLVEIARIRETERARWAVEAFNAISRDLPQAPGSTGISQGEDGHGGPIRDKIRYSSGHAALPTCDCRSSRKTSLVTRCGLHTVAPQLLTEGKMLLEQHDELRGRLGNIRSTVKCHLEQSGSPPNPGALDIEAELSRASWIRRQCDIAS